MAFAMLALVASILALPQSAEARGRARHHVWAGRHFAAYAPVGATDPGKDAALIIDADSGRVLYSRNPYASRHPASLTKMMTLYLLFDAMKKGTVNLNTALAISAHAAGQKPTNLHLWAGDQITVENAIKAIVIRSANDVAVAIAEGLGGTESHFAQMMTQTAREMGMNNTFFHNASGLPDSMQVTTANDLSVLARHLYNDFPQYFPYFATPSFYYRGVNYVTHDNLIGRYDGTDGIKTGYTQMSGFNLVSSVHRNGRHLIGVVMGGRTARKRDGEMMALLDDAFGVKSYTPQSTLLASNTPAVPLLSAPPPAPTVADVPLKLSVLPKPRPQAPAVPVKQAQLPKLALNLRPAVPPANLDDEDRAESIIFADDPVLPKPKPILVAAYKPKAKQVARLDIGEGDIDDAPKFTPKPVAGKNWTIQIGAFADPNVARNQLANYAERSMDLLGQAHRIVAPFKGTDGNKLFRARFGLFAEKEARAVCATLSKRGQTCFAASTN
jgi:D-alanyl-D-alanine carboxypeptidase